MRLNEIAKPTRNITPAASQAEDEASVPSATSIAPTRVAVRYAIARGRRMPPKSEMTRSEKQPNTMKMTICGSRRPRSANAKAIGMTMAARTARRRAAKPGSRGALTVMCSRLPRACERINVTSSVGAFDEARDEAGARGVGALEKPEDRFFRRWAGADVLI